MFRELFNLFFPRLCSACNDHLLHAEEHICTLCRYGLPRTNYHTKESNPLEKVFWGRADVKQAFAFLFFRKEGITQHLLHQLKYKGNKELAEFIGRMYATEIKHKITLPDAVVAVPLHIKKLRLRGYNQSAYFAQGLADGLNIPDLSHAIFKQTATSTQTKKSRFERWKNVHEVFALKHPELLEGKHILLCDDVITTGATIEALIQVMPQSCNISVCSIAFAEKAG